MASWGKPWNILAMRVTNRCDGVPLYKATNRVYLHLKQTEAFVFISNMKEEEGGLIPDRDESERRTNPPSILAFHPQPHPPDTINP